MLSQSMHSLVYTALTPQLVEKALLCDWCGSRMMQYAAPQHYKCMTGTLEIHCRLGIVNLAPDGSML